MAQLYWPYGPWGRDRIGPRGPGSIIVLALGALRPSEFWPESPRGGLRRLWRQVGCQFAKRNSWEGVLRVKLR
jgi:hypothetical protein